MCSCALHLPAAGDGRRVFCFWEEEEERKEQRFAEMDRKGPPLETKGGAPSSPISLSRDVEKPTAQAGMLAPHWEEEGEKISTGGGGEILLLACELRMANVE